jgi:hypothetical protein
MAGERMVAGQFGRGGTKGGERRLGMVATNRLRTPTDEMREGSDILGGGGRPVEPLDPRFLGRDLLRRHAGREAPELAGGRRIPRRKGRDDDGGPRAEHVLQNLRQGCHAVREGTHLAQ